MTIETALQGQVGTVKVAGRMEHDQSPQFEAACVQLVKQGARHILADLSGLDYVSSMGIRAFLSVVKDRENAGAQLVLIGMSGFVRQVFDLTRLTPLFRTADSVEAALAALP